MPSSASEYEPKRIARAADRFWQVRHLPPASGVLGPPDGPVLHELEGGIVAPEEANVVAYRAVAADVDARYLHLVGRRSDGTLRWEAAGDRVEERPEARLLRSLAVWTGGTGGVPWDSEDRHAKVERMVGRLARRGAIVARDLPLRLCPTCVQPRSPERIIYQEEDGQTYLVRFEVPLDDRVVNALLWVDAPWRLLGTSAILVHPDAPYVIARYRRKDAEELVLTSRSSLARFHDWLPDATFEVLEEKPGREFAGRTYVYPLRHEFPMGGTLTPPGGTVLAVPDVTATGTGVVPLVPGHQSTDAIIAEAKGVPGWPLVTPKGRLDVTLVHKYAGLDLKTANEFVVRDLSEGSSVFAILRVRRGVPHCMVCGSPLIWFPGRAWCLEPGRLPSEVVELYRRLLPDAPSLQRVEVAPWPVSETATSDEPSALALLECARCERLDVLNGPAACPCGGKMFPIRRRLVPSFRDAMSAWARHEPFPPGDSVRIYVGERRRVPALVHHLAGLTAVEGTSASVGVTLLPTLPEIDLLRLIESEGPDAVRAALVRAELGEGTTVTLVERCAQERRRLERLWAVADDVLGRQDPAMLSSSLEPTSSHLGELEAEDRALLARWERTRVLAIAEYDRGAAAAVHRRIFRFLETDLADYRRWTRARIEGPGAPATKRSALRSMSYVLRTAVVLLGPIVPHWSEAIFRRFTGDRRSLFESGVGAVDRNLLDERLSSSWDRWRSLLEAIAEFRRAQGLAPGRTIPRGAVILATDDEGDRLRDSREALERLGRIVRLEIASPKQPWGGRQRQVRPIESEIQKVYPTQASQIAHLLRRLPPRRSGEPGGPSELSVVIQGLSRRVSSSMVDFVETVPEGMIPTPWRLGELYLEIPGSGRAERPTPPPLSPDAFGLVRRIERRLRHSRGARDRAPGAVVISAIDPLSTELRAVAEPLARYLEVSEVRVLGSVAAPPPPHRTRGRTRTGARWWIDIPGLPPPVRRPKGRVVRPQSRRVVAPPMGSGVGETEVDYADEKVIAEEEAVRDLNRELDSALRSPVLGPAKVRGAWTRGFRDIGRYREATFDELLELPGFGRSVAEGLIVAFGSPRPSRTLPVPRVVPGPAVRRGPTSGLSTPAPAQPPALPGPIAEAVTPAHELPGPSEPPAPAPAPVPLPPRREPEALPERAPGDDKGPAMPDEPAPPEPLEPAGSPAVTAPPILSEAPRDDLGPSANSEAVATAEGPAGMPGDEAGPGGPREETAGGTERDAETPAPAGPEPTEEVPEALEPSPEPPSPAEDRGATPPSSLIPEPEPAAPSDEAPDASVSGEPPLTETPSPPAPQFGTGPPGDAPAELEPAVGPLTAEEKEVHAPPILEEPTAEAVPGPEGPRVEEVAASGAERTEAPASPAAEAQPTVSPPPAVEVPELVVPEPEPVVTVSEEMPSSEAPAPAPAPEVEAEAVESAPGPVPEVSPGSDVDRSAAAGEGGGRAPLGADSGPSEEGALTETEPSIEIASPVPAPESETRRPGTRSPRVGETGAPLAPDEPTPAAPSGAEEAASLPAEASSTSADGVTLAETPPLTEAPPVGEGGAMPEEGPETPPAPSEESGPPEAVSETEEAPSGVPSEVGPDRSPTEPAPSAPGPPAEAPSDSEPRPPTGPEISTTEADSGAGSATSPGEPPGAQEPPAADLSAPVPTEAVEEPEPAPPVEFVAEPTPVPEIRQGGIELIVGASVVTSLQPFLDATAAGLKGVCVVRESPERIRAQAGSRPVDIYWLTNMSRGRTLRPNDLPGFAAFLVRAMEEEHAQLFFIEGVEYLTHIHGVEAVVARLAEFDRLTREHEVRVWLHVTPGLLRPGDLDRIAAAFPTVP